MSDLAQAHAKLTAARARLILERPFIGALVLHLPLAAASPRWCDTMATDARTLYFNAGYIERLGFAEVQFVLAHEALHCALGHFARRAHRTLRRWDIACDHAVNLLLIDEGLKPPPGALANPGFRGLSAEEIYPLVPCDSPERTLDRHIGDEAGASSADYAFGSVCPGSPENGRGNDEETLTGLGDTWDDAGNERRATGLMKPPREPARCEREALLAAWQTRVVAAAQQVREAGRLSRSWMRLVGDTVQPALPWRVLLARYMMSAARDDYSYQRLSRRDGSAIMPRLAGGEIDVCVALDTSGSIGAGELAEFAAEVDALKSQIRARVTLLACDERLDERGPWRFEAWDPITLPEALGGGAGTSFVPVFDWVAGEQYRPGVLVYFTDGEGDFPSAAPDFPVVWLVKGKAQVPWGERIQLN